MKRIFWIFTVLLAACNPDKDDKKQIGVEVQPLPLETLGLQSSQIEDGCDFQTSFVQWFVSNQTPELTLKDAQCGDSRSDNLPEDFAMLKGKCASVCSVYVFSLQDKENKMHHFYSMVSMTKENRRVGYLTTSDYGPYSLYDKAGVYEADAYNMNISKAPSPKLPLIALTFSEALKK